MDSNVNGRLLPYIHHVMANKIKMDDDESKEHVAIVGEYMESLLSEMRRQDPMFSRMFSRPFYTGSYYDGLRVSEATEFDINIVLSLRMSRGCMQQEQCRDGLGPFCKYALTQLGLNAILSSSDQYEQQVLLSFFRGGYLNQLSVVRWIQSVMDRSLPRVFHPKIYRINHRENGPARTIEMCIYTGKCIAIDLVPVFQIDWPEWPVSLPQDVRIVEKVEPQERFWFLVPKTYDAGDFSVAMQPGEPEILWRVHFPMIEKRLIEDIGCVKPLIKLLKLLRDGQNWNISSYCLKTLLMHLLVENPNPDIWHPSNLGSLLIRVMELLSQHYLLSVGTIPHLFSRDLNLLGNMAPETKVNIAHILNAMTGAIKTNPGKILEFF